MRNDDQISDVPESIGGHTTITGLDEALIILVDYERSYEEGIEAGKYDVCHRYLTEESWQSTLKIRKNSVLGGTETQIIFVSFKMKMSTDQVHVELDKRNLRPADLLELLAVGQKYPTWQGRYDIIALGSELQLYRSRGFVPFLSQYKNKRNLLVRTTNLDWNATCRFAAVSK